MSETNLQISSLDVSGLSVLYQDPYGINFCFHCALHEGK